MKSIFKVAPLLALSFGLTACFGSGSQQDLDDYIAETKRRPKGQIEPMPSFRPYEAFTYSASRLRNPFEPPVEDQRELLLSGDKSVKPDFNRPKEVLESFNLASLSMVGSFQKQGKFWALIQDGEANIHPISIGNYMGKNHGRVVAASPSEISLIEIVTDGLDGWVERPKTIKLTEKE